MAKWKLFGRSKQEKEETMETRAQPSEDIEAPQEEPKGEPNTQESEEPSVVEHRETLYSKGTAPKKQKTSSKADDAWKRERWESVDTVEKNVDGIPKGKGGVTKDSKAHPSNVDKQVDRLLSKKKK